MLFLFAPQSSGALGIFGAHKSSIHLHLLSKSKSIDCSSFPLPYLPGQGCWFLSRFDFDEHLRCGGIWPKDSPQDQDCSIWRRRISPRPMGNAWWDYICCLNIRVWKVGMSEKPWLKIVWVSRVFPNFENHTYQYFDLMTQLGSWQTDIDWSYI